jgi:hypothetical protein
MLEEAALAPSAASFLEHQLRAVLYAVFAGIVAPLKGCP